MNDPLNPLVVTVGRITGGQRFNILADKVILEGTTRTHSPEMRQRTEPLLRRIVENTADSMGAKATLSFEYFPAPIINDHEDLVQIARNAATKCMVLSPETISQMMISEDSHTIWKKSPVSSVLSVVRIKNLDSRPGITMTSIQ